MSIKRFVALLSLLWLVGLGLVLYTTWIHAWLSGGEILLTINKSGEEMFEFWAFWIIFPILAVGLYYVIEHMHQLGELKQREKTLEEEIQQKTNFIMLATHELRTPLQPVLGYLELLLSDPEAFRLSDEAFTILNRCHTNISHQNQIIDRLLTLSIVDTGNVSLVYETLYPHSCIEKILTATGSRNNAEIMNLIPENVEMNGDLRIFSRIFNALIINAVQYNDSPRIVWLRYDEDRDYHIISVEDNGYGIDNSTLSRIFEPFFLSDIHHLTNSREKHIGLSLPIVKRYIGILGGKIHVESIPSTGCTFTVYLPRRKDVR